MRLSNLWWHNTAISGCWCSKSLLKPSGITGCLVCLLHFLSLDLVFNFISFIRPFINSLSYSNFLFPTQPPFFFFRSFVVLMHIVSFLSHTVLSFLTPIFYLLCTSPRNVPPPPSLSLSLPSPNPSYFSIAPFPYLVTF